MNTRRLVSFVSPILIFSAIFVLTASTAFALGATWTQHTEVGQFYWTGTASSADGMKLAVAADENDASEPGYIWTSTDGGATWTQRTGAGLRKWSTITSSADGMRLAASPECSATCDVDYLYSSNDGGVTWTQGAGTGAQYWFGITSSADGLKLAAASNGDNSTSPGYIYTSTDGGTNWTPQTGSGLHWWRYITSSADGTKLAATESDTTGYIWTSSDSGVTWTQTSAPAKTWNGITSSADGTKLAAVAWIPDPNNPGQYLGEYIYTSTDGGMTWAPSTSAGQKYWVGIASSADGTKLAATPQADSSLAHDYIYTSTDGGANWTPQIDAGARSWEGIASSADGSKLLAGDSSSPAEYVYTATLSPTLTTSDASPLGATSATLNGSIDAIGNDNPTTRGFVYGTDTSYGATTTESDNFSTGSFSADISSLTCNTAYHFAAYATNGYLGYGSDNTFTTSACPAPPPAPVVSSGGGWSGGCSTYPQGELPSWGVVPCTPTNPSQGPAVLPGGIQIWLTAPATQPSLQSQGSTLQNGGGITLSKNHQLYDVSSDIKLLQQFLNTHGFTIAKTGPGSTSNETTFFGSKTYQALIKFQKANGILATGYLGPLTRALVNSQAH